MYQASKLTAETRISLELSLAMASSADSSPSPLYNFNMTGLPRDITSSTSNTTLDDSQHYVVTPEELEETQKAQVIFEAVMAISNHYLWILFALGFPGNCAAIVTIFRMKSIGTFPVFVVMLAVMDSMALLVKLLYYELFNHQVDIGDAGCCLLRFLGSWTSAYSSWILVFMALERFVAVRFPLKMTMHSGCNTHKVVAVLVVVGAVVALIYMPLLWTTETVNVVDLRCQYKPHFAKFMENVYDWILAAVYAFVPFGLLTTFNFLIAKQIRNSFKVRSAMRNTQLLPYNHGCYDVSIHRQVSLMLLSATVVFVVLTFPICIFILVDSHWHTGDGYNRSVAVKMLCGQLAYVLVDSTHAVNFYLYFLTARRFRHHFLRMVTCKSCYCSIKSTCQHAWRGSDQSEVEDL